MNGWEKNAFIKFQSDDAHEIYHHHKFTHLISGEYSCDGRRWSSTKSFTLLAKSSALLKPSSSIDGLVERHRPSNSTKSFFLVELVLLFPLLDSS
jgi:hypothetical protein